jgi:hypothetical protein
MQGMLLKSQTIISHAQLQANANVLANSNAAALLMPVIAYAGAAYSPTLSRIYSTSLLTARHRSTCCTQSMAIRATSSLFRAGFRTR